MRETLKLCSIRCIYRTVPYTKQPLSVVLKAVFSKYQLTLCVSLSNRFQPCHYYRLYLTCVEELRCRGGTYLFV